MCTSCIHPSSTWTLIIDVQSEGHVHALSIFRCDIRNRFGRCLQLPTRVLIPITCPSSLPSTHWGYTISSRDVDNQAQTNKERSSLAHSVQPTLARAVTGAAWRELASNSKHDPQDQVTSESFLVVLYTLDSLTPEGDCGGRLFEYQRPLQTWDCYHLERVAHNNATKMPSQPVSWIVAR